MPPLHLLFGETRCCQQGEPAIPVHDPHPAELALVLHEPDDQSLLVLEALNLIVELVEAQLQDVGEACQ